MPRSEATKAALLDAAEQLFARDGYKNATLRSITAAAGVNLAAVNYHFGSKKTLLEAVFARRLTPLNIVRMRELNIIGKRCDAQGTAPATAEVLQAFMLPVLRFRQNAAEGHHFSILVGRALIEADATVRDIFVRLMEPVFSRCFFLLCRAQPHLSRQVVFCRFNFVLGAMSRGMCLAADAPLLPEGVAVPATMQELSSCLITFVTAGMEAS